ncbi:MAG: helix-turn-helix domain-containing protein [Planktothrix sp.]|uniref:helix-turn-helix domain-containing protein n=1 Tax=Planktothrix sp. TaxID=3088171 RepID=UPI0038D3FC2A
MNPLPETEKVEKPTLKKLIANAGTTQRELSEKTGIKEVTLNSWVAGKKTPRLDNAVVVAKALGVSLKALSESLGLDTSGLPDDN